jgi:hypothetical protein
VTTMNDARIAIGLPSHPKTKKLIRRLGQQAGWNLVCLILWTASNRPDGDLCGMSIEDIELAADWHGEDGAFVAALADVRFFDGEDGCYMLHDWHEHNPWAAGSNQRSAKARWNAVKRHHGIAEADRLVPEYAAIRNADRTAICNAGNYAASTTPVQGQQSGSNAPSPSPSPSLNTPIPPEGAPQPRQAKTMAVSLPTWLATIKAAGQKAIPDDDPVRVYAAEVGIGDDLMRLAWFEFRQRYSEAGAKRYKDWRAVFRKSVRANWLRLWYRTDDGYTLTTAGHQAQAAMEATA